ncbi:putative phage holin [Rhodococcus sp. SJ-2]
MRHLILTAAALACAIIILIFDAKAEARILLTSMTVLAAVFVIRYAWVSDWRATPGGRSLMYVAGSLVLIGSQLISVWWLGDYPGRDVVRSVTVSVLVLALLHRLIALIAQQRRDRDRVEGRRGAVVTDHSDETEA